MSIFLFRPLQRRWIRPSRTAALLISLAIIASACGSSDGTAEPPADRLANQSLEDLAVRPSPGSDQDGGTTSTTLDAEDSATTSPTTTSTTTTTTSTTTTVPPTTTTTEPPLLSTVRLSPNGSDSGFGGAGDPVASVERALARMEPGGTIEFEPGQYPPLTIDGVNGTSGQPIRLLGGPGVEFRGSGYSADAGILVTNSSNIDIVNMTVRTALWGIYVEASSGISILNNDVGDIGQEAIRVKSGSNNILIDGNRISETGRRTDQGVPNGEGIYIGTGTPAGEDLVSNVVISNNILSTIRDEAIDIKRPATNITVIDNTITNVVTHTSGAIVVHLNNESNDDPNINIERNIVRNVTRQSEFQDGNCIVAQTSVRIVNNVLHNCQHRGIYLRGSAGSATIIHNTFLNTGSLGAIVDEGLGIDFVSENNLGVAGGTNVEVTASDFVAAAQSDYRLNPTVAAEFDDAVSTGVTDDLLGAARTLSGNVTYGAIESQ